MNNKNQSIQTSIAPWLAVPNVAKAVDFYTTAFDAVEIYRLEAPDGGLVVQLAVNGAAFWLSNTVQENEQTSALPLGGDNVRMILTVSNPEALFAKALQAGATEVFPVGEEYGWKLGRIADPFGLHWEIGHPVAE